MTMYELVRSNNYSRLHETTYSTYKKTSHLSLHLCVLLKMKFLSVLSTFTWIDETMFFLDFTQRPSTTSKMIEPLAFIGMDPLGPPFAPQFNVSFISTMSIILLLSLENKNLSHTDPTCTMLELHWWTREAQRRVSTVKSFDTKVLHPTLMQVHRCARIFCVHRAR